MFGSGGVDRSSQLMDGFETSVVDDADRKGPVLLCSVRIYSDWFICYFDSEVSSQVDQRKKKRSFMYFHHNLKTLVTVNCCRSLMNLSAAEHAS